MQKGTGPRRVAVVMAGGGGERFWPLSRMNHPKQLLYLTSRTQTMLAEAIARLTPLIPAEDVYVATARHLVDSIRAGKPINNSNYMFTSTMLGILGQMVCYTGQMITWEQAMSSQLSFALPKYGFDVEPPVKPGPDGIYPTAMPGVTKFI